MTHRQEQNKVNEKLIKDKCLGDMSPGVNGHLNTAEGEIISDFYGSVVRQTSKSKLRWSSTNRFNSQTRTARDILKYQLRQIYL